MQKNYANSMADYCTKWSMNEVFAREMLVYFFKRGVSTQKKWSLATNNSMSLSNVKTNANFPPVFPHTRKSRCSHQTNPLEYTSLLTSKTSSFDGNVLDSLHNKRTKEGIMFRLIKSETFQNTKSLLCGKHQKKCHYYIPFGTLHSTMPTITCFCFSHMFTFTK